MSRVRWPAVAVVAVVATLLGGALGTGCGGSRTQTSDGPALPRVDDSCMSDNDCDVADTCCTCDEGGKRIAMRRDALAEFMGAREERCGGVTCAQMISIDPSCRASVRCGNFGRCQLVPLSRPGL
jgi:hypothetical protein